MPPWSPAPPHPQVEYTKIKEIRSAPRAFGLWGDVVFFLKDGSRLPLAGLERYQVRQRWDLCRQVCVTTDAKPSRPFFFPHLLHPSQDPAHSFALAGVHSTVDQYEGRKGRVRAHIFP